RRGRPHEEITVVRTPMRTPLIAGNWKMYKTIAEAITTVDALAPLLEGVQGCEVLVAPVFTAIRAVADRLRGTAIFVAAQDVAAESGQVSYTGEVSAELLVDAGATHCIVGHSERRQYFCETDTSVNRKL